MARPPLVWLLLMASCAARTATPSPAPEPTPAAPINPYGDLLAHEVMQDVAPASDDQTLREEGVLALDEGRYEEARDIFEELLEHDSEDESLVRLHGRAESLASAAAQQQQQWSVGIPECDEYLEHYVRCIDMLPEAAREPTREALEQTVEAWREAAKGPGREMLGDACNTAREAAERATQALGCEW